MRRLFIIFTIMMLTSLLGISALAQTGSGRADLSINQSSLTNPLIAGTGFNYLITVTNSGPNGADDVTVIDTLPTGLRFQSSTGGCTESPIGTLTCNLGLITAGETRSFSISAMVASNLVDVSGGTTNVRNTVSVSSPSRLDPDMSNNTVTLTSSVIASANLSVVSMEIVEPPIVLMRGESAELTLHTVINNAGPSTPVDARFTITGSSDDALIEPTTLASEELALNFNQSRSLDTVFTVTCQGDSSTISFTAEIEALQEEMRDSNPNNNSATAEVTIDCEGDFVPTERPEQEVEIDIRPDNPQNVINLRSNGEFQVAILSDENFDASTLDPGSIRLEGAPVSQTGNGEYKTQLRDVNDDGLDDLVVHIQTEELELSPSDTMARLEAETFDGQEITGWDYIRILSNRNGNGNGNGNANGNSNGNANGNANSNGNGRGNDDDDDGDNDD